MDFPRPKQTYAVPDTPFTVHCYDSLPSTNVFLKDLCSGLPPDTVVWALEQTRGRGRFGRSWYTGAGSNLAFSIKLSLAGLAHELWPNVPQGAALAIARALADLGLSPQIKWPNDVLVNGCKAAGVLCETVEHEGARFAILGIGVNVNSSREELAGIDPPATSLSCELGHEIDLRELLDGVLRRLCRSLGKLEQGGGGLGDLVAQIRGMLAFVGESHTVVINERRIRGRILGINENGTLHFAPEQGDVMALDSSEISFHETAPNA